MIFGLVLIFFSSLFFYGLGDALLPLSVAFISAYLVLPIVNKLQKKGLSRTTATIILIIVFLVPSAILFLLSISYITSNTIQFLSDLPNLVSGLWDNTSDFLKETGIASLSNNEKNLILEQIKNGFNPSALKNLSVNLLKYSFSGLAQIIATVVNLALIPMFFFYVLVDFEKHLKDINSLIPKHWQKKKDRYLDLMNNVFSGYIRGQLLVVACLTVIYSLGLLTIGAPHAMVIGLISGLLSIVPYLGLILGMTIALAVGMSVDFSLIMAIKIGLVYGIAQSLEGFVITPKIVGDKVGLTSFETVLALIVGGNLLGFSGLLFAIPAFAIIKKVIGDIKTQYRKSDFFVSS